MLVANDFVEIISEIVCVEERLSHVLVDEEVGGDCIVRTRSNLHVEVPPKQVKGRYELDVDQTVRLHPPHHVEPITRIVGRDIGLSRFQRQLAS